MFLSLSRSLPVCINVAIVNVCTLHPESFIGGAQKATSAMTQTDRITTLGNAIMSTLTSAQTQLTGAEQSGLWARYNTLKVLVKGQGRVITE